MTQYFTNPTNYSASPGVGVDSITLPKACFFFSLLPFSADMGVKKWISVGIDKETVKDERECQSAKINSWIRNDVNISGSSIPLLCVHLLPSPSSLSSSDAARKPKNCWQTAVWRMPSVFICTRSNSRQLLQKPPPPPVLNSVSHTQSSVQGWTFGAADPELMSILALDLCTTTTSSLFHLQPAVVLLHCCIYCTLFFMRTVIYLLLSEKRFLRLSCDKANTSYGGTG